MSEEVKSEKLTEEELSQTDGGVIYVNTPVPGYKYGLLDWTGYTYVYPYVMYNDYGLGYINGTVSLFQSPMYEPFAQSVYNERVQLIESSVIGVDGVAYQRVFCLLDGRIGYVPVSSITMM